MDNLALQDEQRTEILNGKIYMMASAGINHIRILKNIFRVFDNFLNGKTCEVFSDNVDVKLDKDNTVIPDLSVVCDPSIIEADGIHGAPDLIVEVLSPSTAKRDMEDKKELYEKYGVREYWIISPEERSIRVYLLCNGKLKIDKVYYYKKPDEILPQKDREYIVPEFTTSLFDGLSICLADVFKKI